MCTLAAKKINGQFFIFKNRDLLKKLKTKTSVVKEGRKIRKLLIIDKKGHCEGLNEYGLGLIDATLKPYPPAKYPNSSKIARRVLNQKKIEDAIAIIKNSCDSANTIISDGTKTFIIEKSLSNFAITRVINDGVITNLSIKLSKKNGPLAAESRESSWIRYTRAKKIIKKIHNFQGIIDFLSDKRGYPLYSICRGQESISPTWCSFIYDLKNRTIFFCPTSPDKGTFKKYQL